MRIAVATAAPMQGSSWKAKRWRRLRASTSAPTAPTASCASPTPAAWATSRRPRRGSGALLLARLLPERLEARLLGEYLGRVLGGRLVERARVHLQGGLGVAEALHVLAQDLGADQDVDLGLEQRHLPAMVGELL